MSFRFTISPRRLAANHQNAQHSTGPKTKEGKARSAQNASTHRLYSAHLLQDGEDEDRYLTFRHHLLKDLCPQTFFELSLADRIISLHWRLKRVQAADHHLNQMQNILYQQHLEEEEERVADKRERHLQNCEEMGIECTDEDLQKLDLDERTDPTPNPDPGFFIAHDLFTSHTTHQHSTPFERLLSAEQKLHHLLSKAMKDYHQATQQREKQEQAQAEADDGREPHCPFLDPTRNKTTVATDDTSDHQQEIEEDQDEEQEADDDQPQTPSSTTDNGPRTTDNRAPQCATPRHNVDAPKKIEPTCHSGSQPKLRT